MKHPVTAACAVVAVGIGAGAALATSAAPSAAGAVPVTVTPSSCGPAAGWHRAAGPVTFDLTSRAPGYTAVYLVASSGDVLAETPALGQGSTEPLPVTLTGGRYTLRCVLTDATVLLSGPLRVSGTAAGAATGYRPMPDAALGGPVRSYTRWVAGRLPRLLAACRKLDSDVARGDLNAARTDWLAAHLDYERLGAAYTAFGDFDAKIDGMAGGLPDGTSSPGWTGFFAIEHALWGGRPASALRPLTKALADAVSGLIADFPSEEVDPGDLPLRAHEIGENTLQFQLSGAADYGSGTTLATAYASTQGTAELLSVLTPLLRSLDPPVLPAARRQLAALQSGLLSQRSPDGRWTPASQLSSTAREKIVADLGTLLETLSVIPDVLTPRNGA